MSGKRKITFGHMINEVLSQLKFESGLNMFMKFHIRTSFTDLMCHKKFNS